MRNTILFYVGKEIAKRVSAEDSETYKKVLTVMKFVLANFQRGGEMALKEAAANYMDLHFDDTGTGQIVGSACQMDVLRNGPLSPPIKRSSGATSSKRKKFSVEIESGPANGNKRVSKGCGLCLQYGHDKSNCSLSNVIGRRLTPGSWPSFSAGINILESNVQDEAKVMIDPVVSKDAFALQIVEMVKLTSEGNKTVYKAHPILKGMVLDDDRVYWYDLGTLHSWCNGGKSTSHYILVKECNHGK